MKIKYNLDQKPKHYRCRKCDNVGWYVEVGHAPGCDGLCTDCPIQIQVQCDECLHGAVEPPNV